ncbi:hypothetical protein [Bacillus licheniformis]|uniref:hypothetical protein n=1 Tax=Bacillus licheniformis TaxID=1402 RepID=UPI001CD58487|nr:hypothetical protein [Bacillus licheniformis]MCA1184548.1 hypothetical protein [Bacillus licheniformis]
MGLMLLLIIIMVGVSTIFIFSDPCREFIDYIAGMSFGILAVAVVFIGAMLIAFCIETEPGNPYKADIYSIKDNAKTGGSFVLGSGTVDERQYFYFIEEKDGFKTVNKAAVENSKLKEGDYEKPYVITYDVQFKSSFARFFYGKSLGYKTYEFYLPINTITTEYKIDLE